MESITIITPALCELEAPWAQILAPWSVNLLKDIAKSHKPASSETFLYFGTFSYVRKMISMFLFSVSNLQNCEAVRCLLNVVTVCLSRLNGNDRVDCIDSMLGKYINILWIVCLSSKEFEYTFDFLGNNQCDWVIGHVGRSDPSLVVPRVLELALQKPSPQNIDHVVTILAHLSPLHFSYIRQALLEMFEVRYSILFYIIFDYTLFFIMFFYSIGQSMYRIWWQWKKKGYNTIFDATRFQIRHGIKSIDKRYKYCMWAFYIFNN